MTISLRQSQAISFLATALYELMPGSAFAAVATDHGLTWPPGSKHPAITSILIEALERRPTEFSPMLINIVRRGINYRSRKGNPVTRDEVRALNELILQIGIKIPELVDPAFIESLPRGQLEVAPAQGASAEVLADLLTKYMSVSALEPQPRGYAFEGFLNSFFRAYGLDPKSAFRIDGEQIDGSLQLDGETYLAEAKWQNAPTDAADLYVLQGKVSGKAAWSRGLFISHAGFTAPGLKAFAAGKPTNLICMDGLDLYHVLHGSLDLAEVLRRKARRAAETNEAFVPVRELFAGVT